tara:strand:- start:8 stop:220 length:213 start_codon:yes stop_codon:yes gene_type:complete
MILHLENNSFKSIAFKMQHSTCPLNGGAGEDRTPDLCSASAALSQLSYGPMNGGPSWIRTRDLSLIRTAL